MRYFGHDASAMSATEAARIAAVLPLPKKRGAIAPKGFTRRYGNSIAARVGVVGRDGLDACVYKDTTAPVQKAPPKVSKPTVIPGDEYETATPPPPEETVDTTAINEVEADPLAPAAPSSEQPDMLLPPPPPETTVEEPPVEPVPDNQGS
jgi:monofunctional biosynthetic peptidoglycan transglycosylase